MGQKNTARYIDPVAEFGGLLLEVEKPARYVGGEAGILAPAKKDAVFRTLIAFPDLYEIGMGNQALRIIYNRLNNTKDIVCDRAFAPAPDFEKLLREKKIPLYGLDTGISLGCLDLLMFTLGYELGLGGVLLTLDVSQIPLRCAQRTEEDPIVISGGPAVSNPLPYSPFIDAFWIGEAEAGFFELAAELAHLKKSGEGRAALLEKISSHPNVWVKGKENVRRAVTDSFPPEASVFPVPSMKIVQHHGTVEIMRGCPNGCRFCHAGFWYRPCRQKSIEHIVFQVQEMVKKGGWHEISLSSLSSGDYSEIGELVETLNSLFNSMHVSFQMPSLKVSGFSLDLLEKISVTRKSGLTFAVETPPAALNTRQMSINKEVTRESVIAILEEAKKRGWKTAKFYFMIGLPAPSLELSEEEEIVNFIFDIGKRTRMHFNINVGIFIPKPHTPYQWTPQIDSESAAKKLEFIRVKLKSMGHKVSVSDPLISRIEGLLSRGDERAGLLCEEAYYGGSRLDAWSEYINRDKWLEILEKNSSLFNNFSSYNAPLPWQGISSCVKNEYLLNELEKSNNCQRTVSCGEKCSLCGVCTDELRRKKAGYQKEEKTNHFVNKANIQVNKEPRQSDPGIYRVLFGFSKHGSAVFHGHLSLIEIFSMAFTRAGLPVMYTQGYNPLAKMEAASPLSTGISADCEMAIVDFACKIPPEVFIQNLNMSLPQGIRIEKGECFYISGGAKKHSLSSLLWGFAYKSAEGTDYVKASDDKKYRQSRLENNRSSLFSLRRTEVLARNSLNSVNSEWSSYFDVYRSFYAAII